MPQDIDWSAYFFSPEKNWIQRFERLTLKRFVDSQLADEAYNHAFEKISDDEWALLKKYKGGASQGGFMVTVFSNLLEDFARARFGRKRPPTWIDRLGPIWKRIFQMLCLDRLNPLEIEHRLQQESIQASDVQDAVTLIRAKISDCGGGNMLQSQWSEEDQSAQASFSSSEYGSAIDKQIQTRMVTVLVQYLEEMFDDIEPSTRHLADFKALSARIALSDDERMLLRVVYLDGTTVPKAAALLNIREHTLRRRLKAVLSRIRVCLEDAGIDYDMVLGDEA